MEAFSFSLLKYWRGGSGGGGSAGGGIAVSNGGESSPKPAVLTSAAALSATDTDDDDDDEPFFDLDIAVNETAIGGQQSREGDNAGKLGAAEEGEEEEDDEAPESDTEFNLTLSSASSYSDANLSLSPSDDLFFKGRLVPIIEPLFAGAGKPNLKALPVSLKKSATKLRVFMRGLRKSKPESNNGKISESHAAAAAGEVPVKYLLTKEHISNEDKRFALQRYLKKVKPLYVRVSRRYGQNVRSASHLVAVKASPEDGEASIAASAKLRKLGTFPSALREVSKHLGKTRSAVGAAPPRSRRDDSLLELQDGIQRAILHCKTSFNLSSSAGSESSMILQSVSDALQAKPPRESEEEDNRECCV